MGKKRTENSYALMLIYRIKITCEIRYSLDAMCNDVINDFSSCMLDLTFDTNMRTTK